MDEGNHTLHIAERLIHHWFPRQFGDRYRIERIVSSSFDHNDREVYYITVYLAPGGPPLDHRETSEFDMLLKEVMIGHNIREWPAIAFVTQDRQGL